MDKTITAICTYTYSDEPVTMVFTGDDNLLQLSYQLIEADSIDELKTIKISGNGQGSAYNESLDEGLLDGAENLISADLTELNTSNVINMSNMFYDCGSLTELNLSSFDTSNVTSMRNMFYGCNNLTELDLRSFDTTRVNDTSYMFYNCSKLETIYNNNDWDSPPNINSSAEMFKNCFELSGAIAYNQNRVDITKANPKTGYFTNSMATKVIFRRKKTAEIDNLPIRDGQLIYDTETGKTYLDNGNQRIATGRESRDTVPIGAIIEYDGGTVPEGYEVYIDYTTTAQKTLFETTSWDSMMTRFQTKSIDFTPYDYVEVEFTGQGGTNATNTILKIDLHQPVKTPITNDDISYNYGASVCYPDIQLLQGANNDPGIFRIGACISTAKDRIWMGDPGYFSGQTSSGNFDTNSVYNRISKIVGFKFIQKLKKKFQGALADNKIINTYSESQTDTYSCNYVNNMITSNEINKNIVIEDTNTKLIDLVPSSMTIASTTEYTTTSTSAEKLHCELRYSVGNKLIYDSVNGNIKIGAGVSYIKVNANITIKTPSVANGRHQLYVYKNDNYIASSVIRANGTNTYQSICITPMLDQVSENDVISLYIRSQDGAGAVTQALARACYLTVEVIE